MLSTQFSAVFLGFVLSAAAGALIEDYNTLGLFGGIACGYFLLRYVWYYSAELRLVEALEKGSQIPDGVRMPAREGRVLVLTTLAAIAASIAGRKVGDPQVFIGALTGAALLGGLSAMTFTETYPDLQVDGRKLREYKASWLTIVSAEVLLGVFCGTVLYAPDALKQRLISSLHGVYGGQAPPFKTVGELDAAAAVGYVVVLGFVLLLEVLAEVGPGVVRRTVAPGGRDATGGAHGV